MLVNAMYWTCLYLLFGCCEHGQRLVRLNQVFVFFGGECGWVCSCKISEGFEKMGMCSILLWAARKHTRVWWKFYVAVELKMPRREHVPELWCESFPAEKYLYFDCCQIENAQVRACTRVIVWDSFPRERHLYFEHASKEWFFFCLIISLVEANFGLWIKLTTALKQTHWLGRWLGQYIKLEFVSVSSSSQCPWVWF